MRWFTTALLCIMLPLFSTAQRHHASHAKKHSTSTKPQFIGGAMGNFIASHLRYPDAEKEADIQGRALVAFTIAATGAITDVTIERSSGTAGLDAEAVRCVKSMPRWKPATVKGKKVAYRFILPVTFELD